MSKNEPGVEIEIIIHDTPQMIEIALGIVMIMKLVCYILYVAILSFETAYVQLYPRYSVILLKDKMYELLTSRAIIESFFEIVLQYDTLIVYMQLRRIYSVVLQFSDIRLTFICNV